MPPNSPRLVGVLYQALDSLDPGLARWFARRLHNERRTVSTPHGVFWIDPISSFGESLATGDEPEPDTANAIDTYLSTGRVFVDIGANEGYFTVQAAKRCGPTGRVYAVEPQPGCREVLEKNLRLNGATNVTVVSTAVSDYSGTLKLHLHGATNTGAASIVRPSRLSWHVLKADCMPLERLLQQQGVGTVDLLKIDVEGAEYAVLMGSAEVFRSGRVRALVLEYHPHLLARQRLRASDIHAFLLANGFELDPAISTCRPPESLAGRAVYQWTGRLPVAHERIRSDRESFHDITRQTVSGLSWTAVALLVAFATKIVLTRKMAPREMGILLAAQSFIGLALAAGELGIPDAVVRYIGRDAAHGAAPKRTVYLAVKIVTAATLLTAVVAIAAIVLWFGSYMATDALWATVILTATLPLLALGDVLGAAYRGVSRLGTKLFVLDVARPGLVVIALALSPLVLTRQAPYVAGLYAGGALVALAGLWALFARDRRWHNDTSTTSSELLRFGVPIAGAALIAGPLTNSVLPLMLTTWAGPAAVAFFSIAISLQAIVNLPTAVFEQAVVPQWARMVTHARSEEMAASYQQFANMCFATATSIGLLIVANDMALLAFLFGAPYQTASWAVRCAVIATIFGALTGPNEGMLRALGLSGSIFYARIAAAVAGVIAGVMLISPYGLAGAIVAFVVINVVLNVSYSVALYRNSGLHPFTWPHGTTTAMAFAGLLAATGAIGVYPLGGRVAAHLLAVAVVALNADLREAVRNLVWR